MFNRDKLKLIIDKRGWTNYKLAKEAKIGQTTIHDILGGKKVTPNGKTLAKIADALGVSVDEFFDDNLNIEEKPIDEINKMVKDNGINTIAAHFEGDEFTEDDKDDIENFIKYVLSKKKQK